ncbi:succinate dehydrogenase subunit 3-2, mitochondrial-like [Typha angustifolia]|uniref:succinate dehydrogenase subunit 3-2, mitochondrial-like n=1 Tax=Typha angustifolia TaxID=59011 RepID=UPI003C2CF5B3
MATHLKATAADAGTQKIKMNTHFMLQRGTPFAVSGIFGNTNSGLCSMDGVGRPLPSSEQLRAYKTITRFPYASSLPLQASQLVKSPKGSQALHSSQVLESSRGATSNRPLSPHLPLKKPQLSATYSISHRIFGVGLCSLIMLTPLAMKFSLLYDI